MVKTRVPSGPTIRAGSTPLDDDARYLAVRSRDARFDGWFFVAITSTGIYCRPSCPSPPARPSRVRFFPTAAAAQRAGFRACKRCLPDATPGSPEWDRRADAVGRAMRLIADGVVDRDGVPGLARRLGYSERHLNRLLLAEVGAGPLALARAQRAQTARILLETTELRAAEIAFAAGFSSVRQFNDTIREVFALAPMALRSRAASRRSPRAAVASVRRGPSPSSSPTDPRCEPRSSSGSSPLGRFPESKKATGSATAGRSACLTGPASPRSPSILPPMGTCGASLSLEDLRDLTAAVRRLRRLFDLDADPVAVAEALGADAVLGQSVISMPGLRTPGHVDGDELAFRAVLGQQVSVAGARTVAGRLAARAREGAGRSVRIAHPPLPDRRSDRRPRARTAAHARQPWRGHGPARLRTRLGRGDAGRRRRPGRRCRAAAGHCRHRSVDRRLYPHAWRSATPTRSCRAISGCGGRSRPAACRAIRAARRRWPSRGAPGARTPCSTCGPGRWTNPRAGRPTPNGEKGASGMTLIDNEAAAFRTGGDEPPTFRTIYRAPIGEILLVADDDGLRELRLPGPGTDGDRPPAGAGTCAPLEEAVEQLEAYFAGELTNFDLPLVLRGRLSSVGSGGRWRTSPTAAPRATGPWRRASAIRRRAGRSAWRTTRTRSRSCSRATGSSGRTASSSATAAGSG